MKILVLRFEIENSLMIVPFNLLRWLDDLIQLFYLSLQYFIVYKSNCVLLIHKNIDIISDWNVYSK